MKDMGPVYKNATNPAYHSKYANLAAVIETVSDPMHNNGLLVLQPVLSTPDGEMIVNTMIVHPESGETIESSYPVRCKDTTDPQKVGAGVTYARRYGLLALLGIATEDDDGNTAAAPPQRRQEPNNEPLDFNSTRARQMTDQSSSSPDDPITPRQVKFVWAIAGEMGIDEAAMHDGIAKHYRKSSVNDLTRKEASDLIDRMQSASKRPSLAN